MEKFEKPIYVTKPFMPPLEEFCEGLKEVWENQWLTNNGPVLGRYREELKNYFETDNICLFNNGTLALQIALQGMGISGEVITTPFTFVATTHALYWNKIRPVFCDIEPDYFTLDPEKVEELITPWTTAILAVHVFGRPCKLNALADIAKRHNLALIYDAAHAFGGRVNGKPIGHYGDLSMFSFHATKLYHSIEGGMLTFKDPGLAQTFNYLKNFGFKSETEVVMPGTNAKMNEMQALMGSVVLNYMDHLLAKRKQVYEIYKERLQDVPGISFSPDSAPNVDYNYAYVPILVDEKEFGMSRDALYEKFKEYNVFARRYFYPLLNEFACYQSVSISKPLTVANQVAEKVLTLPTYADLEEDDVNKICDVIISV
ncbi:DegT/DnrJ/EryC1/StrS family aminotransferase [Desulfoluna spongiiphila]|uniref:DegT/DnrJ/EryC1/StrS family aminotransferase n=1 Tax=Desulfoluna spongiiphila TaxID=419481 RepID=UPI001257DFB2|nr:DegT/DnrJ/EryC1/StrS family aminotransferase [Desulfoluna spongiiphila]VVS95287.1 degt/dnrj/eryc1/strs aminotransferase [Desulfoluna spongiiphila]